MTQPAMRVVSLQASNILRLSAVEFTWKDGQRVLTLGGKNGAGKSSVLNAVAMALGGMALCPDEPLKRGEHRGFVELNLGGLLVRREFWRDLLVEQPKDGPPAYGETKSRLIVKNPEGVKQEPAQRLLDTLVGKLTFDPTAFAMDDEKKQAETLRQLVGLDFTEHDEQRSIAYDTRAVYNKQYREQLVLLDAMPKYDDVPEHEVSTDALLDELNACDVAARALDVAERTQIKAGAQLRLAQSDVEAAKRRVADAEQEIARAQQRLTEAQHAWATNDKALAVAQTDATVATAKVTAAKNAVPDRAEITQRFHGAEDVNSKVRANAARRATMTTVVKLQAQAEGEDLRVKQLDALREKTLQEAAFPVPGLSFNAAGIVTFGGIAFKQASTAEQIRVSVAIGFALNPSLKLLCVRNGNVLDDDSFKLIADAAAAASGQVLMEIVTKDASGVSVFIEDGHN